LISNLDGEHPNVQGYAFMARVFFDAIKQAFEIRSTAPTRTMTAPGLLQDGRLHVQVRPPRER
jgi:hypothetical protein